MITKVKGIHLFFHTTHQEEHEYMIHDNQVEKDSLKNKTGIITSSDILKLSTITTTALADNQEFCCVYKGNFK